MDKNQNGDRLTDHDYDGIQEYDNQLPRWWVGTFIITVLFGLGYWLYYHVYSMGPDQKTEYEMALAEHEKSSRSSAQDTDDLTDEVALSLSRDSKIMAEAATIFQQNCAACHGPQAQGIIGPNLTDKYWLHGNKAAQLFHTIENGVPEKGMIPWKGTLSQDQIRKMVAFIFSIQGSNPPNPKPPQGDLAE